MLGNINNISLAAEQEKLASEIGYELMGPVVHRWLLALHQYICYHDDGDTRFLLCARAGVRIGKLYEIFRQGWNCDNEAQPSLFWVSRLSVAKGVFGLARERSLNAISREYQHIPLRILIEGLLRHNPEILSKLDLTGKDLMAHGYNFPGWMEVNGAVQIAVHDYLKECSAAFEAYLNETVAGKSRVALIDSGWQGSTQSLLSTAWPDIEWKGLYFGRILTEGHDSNIVPNIIGLMFEQSTYSAHVPESAFVRHRHLIESILEPNAPSIEEIPAGLFQAKARNLIRDNINEIVSSDKDNVYINITRYIEDHADASIAEIISQHQKVMPTLARIIISPTKEEAFALAGKDRSADFGKDLMVPVLRGPNDTDFQDKDQRIKEALWHEGQVALEYEGGIAQEMQFRINGIADDASHFDPSALEMGSIEHEGVARIPDPCYPKVAIITRTKNRPILLKRAASSVASQTFEDYVWVIVNDGGDDAAVRNIIARSAIDRQRIILVSNPRSLGMEAASNAGINACRSDFIVIHDDDDSWSPHFLESTVNFLESSKGKRYGGVITHTVYVSEEIRGDQVIEHGKYPYHDWVHNVQLSEMACENFYPPIAFLFRRKIWEEVGGYNENLPVLGDWFFNMEFLLNSDIGVIPEAFANYHHRDRGDSRSGLYSNSVIGGHSKHAEFSSIARNEFLRRHATKTSAALSVALGYILKDVRGRQDRIAANMTQNPAPIITNSDRADLYWTVAQINHYLADNHLLTRPSRFLSKRKKIKLLEPSSNWESVIHALKATGCSVPAPEDFNEVAYLDMNHDVAEAVRVGKCRNGYMHYLMYGRAEGRIRP